MNGTRNRINMLIVMLRIAGNAFSHKSDGLCLYCNSINKVVEFMAEDTMTCMVAPIVSFLFPGLGINMSHIME